MITEQELEIKTLRSSLHVTLGRFDKIQERYFSIEEDVFLEISELINAKFGITPSDVCLSYSGKVLYISLHRSDYDMYLVDDIKEFLQENVDHPMMKAILVIKG